LRRIRVLRDRPLLRRFFGKSFQIRKSTDNPELEEEVKKWIDEYIEKSKDAEYWLVAMDIPEAGTLGESEWMRGARPADYYGSFVLFAGTIEDESYHLPGTEEGALIIAPSDEVAEKFRQYYREDVVRAVDYLYAYWEDEFKYVEKRLHELGFEDHPDNGLLPDRLQYVTPELAKTLREREKLEMGLKKWE